MHITAKGIIECHAAIRRGMLVDSHHINLGIIHRIHSNAGKVHRSGIKAVNPDPAFTTILGTIDSTKLVTIAALPFLNVMILATQGKSIGAILAWCARPWR